MANAIYPKAKEAAWQGNLDAATGTLKAILIDTADYTYAATHEFLSDVIAAGRVATSAALGSKTFTDGVLDAADATFTSASGDVSEALILFLDSGVEATSRLLVYLDTGVTGLPVTPNGGDINVAWDSGANKICAL